MLIDIDELIIKCTDNNSKLFIEEAVKSYKAGAYRACINNTWLAIVMNITFKIEQLALMNDAEAIKQKEILDKIKETNNIVGMLNFEREILKTAKEKFELFDDIVLIDLQRIQEDRNRCSHPLLNIDNEPFIPTAELARHHLYLAVDKVISEGNVFGKAALDKILQLINNPIFPIRYEDVSIVLQKSYLSSPKKSLIVNLIKILIKDILNSEKNIRLNMSKENVLKFLIYQYRDITEETLRASLNKFINVANILHLRNSRNLIYIDSVIWEILTEDTKIMIQQYVLKLPPEHFEDIETWLSFAQTKQQACIRIHRSTREELMSHSPFFIVPKQIRERIFELYLQSKNYNEANNFSDTVLSIIDDAEKDELIQFIKKVRDNSQVYNSNSVGTVFWKIKNRDFFTEEEFNQILRDNDLKKFIVLDIPF